jgi:acetyltransferase-like isoleucine patch superfamily enzyme
MATFTALNGTEPKPPDNSNASPPARQLDPEENAGSATAGQEQQRTPADLAGPREHWSGSGSERLPYQSSYTEPDGPHKRKRTHSPEPPHSRDGRPDETGPVHRPRTESRDSYGAPRDREYRPYADDSREDSWYSQSQTQRDERSPYEQQNSAKSLNSHGDELMSDSQHGPPGATDTPQGYSPTSPDDGDEPAYYGNSFGPDHRRDSAVQSDPKKRKRNFSNRTKTGCLTCRKRKKKCDELKPECECFFLLTMYAFTVAEPLKGNNCLRGGFICQGYPNQRGYQKMESKPSAVPLESKDPSYIPPGAYGMPQPASYASQIQPPPKREPPAPYRNQPSLRIDTPQGRPVLTDDDRTASTIPTASVASPDNKLSALSSYTAAANVFPTPISAISSATTNFGGEQRGLQKEYSRIPPLHDTSRTEPETPHPGNALPQINILHPTRTSSPQSQPQPPTSNPQVAAQLALSHNHLAPVNRGPTQKELMLRGERYKPFDKELVLQRERCSAACWRFNNSTNPNNGVSATERARLFREILMPKEPINLSPSQQSPINNIGRVGTECVVEAPFTCDYGYNIAIGHNVFIGRNCTILDPCSVRIGNNVYIGPNVSLFAATLATDPKLRAGSKSSQQGGGIVIEDDAFIGGGVIILPNRRVGKGATVAAGAIVTKVGLERFPNSANMTDTNHGHRMYRPTLSSPATPPP